MRRSLLVYTSIGKGIISSSTADHPTELLGELTEPPTSTSKASPSINHVLNRITLLRSDLIRDCKEIGSIWKMYF